MLTNLVVMGAMIVLLSAVSFAKEGVDTDKIVLLYDSAYALQASNPKLAKDMIKFADEKEKKLENSKAGKQEQTVPKEQDIKKLNEDHIKLLRDSAALILQSYPEIAKGLTQMADNITKAVEKK